VITSFATQVAPVPTLLLTTIPLLKIRRLCSTASVSARRPRRDEALLSFVYLHPFPSRLYMLVYAAFPSYPLSFTHSIRYFYLAPSNAPTHTACLLLTYARSRLHVSKALRGLSHRTVSETAPFYPDNLYPRLC
jgi:hypothetical protein